MIDGRGLALRAAEILYDKKAVNIIALDVSHMHYISSHHG